MFNMARADSYRLAHSKGFYVTEIVLIGLIIVNVATQSLSMVLGSDRLRAFQSTVTHLDWTGAQSIKMMSSMASLLIYILLPIFSITIGFEFSRDIYKNPLSSGMTRLNYFISKYIIYLFLSLFQLILYYTLIYLTSGIQHGFGHTNGLFWTSMLRTFGVQYLNFTALFTLAMLVMYLSFSVLITVIFTIIFPIILSIFFQIFPHAHWINLFAFQQNIDSAYFSKYSGVHLTEMLGATFGTIVVSLIIAYIVFKKRDL